MIRWTTFFSLQIYSFNNRLQVKGITVEILKEWMISEKENKKILFQILAVGTYATFTPRTCYTLGSSCYRDVCNSVPPDFLAYSSFKIVRWMTPNQRSTRRIIVFKISLGWTDGFLFVQNKPSSFRIYMD